jgi:hypothetical protein
MLSERVKPLEGTNLNKAISNTISPASKLPLLQRIVDIKAYKVRVSE